MPLVFRKLETPILIIIGLGVIGIITWLGVAYAGARGELVTVKRELTDARHENSELSDALTNSQATVAEFEKQVRDLSSTVGTLVKLKDTDPELLQKYSKVYFLSDNYIPRGIADINAEYILDPARKLQFLSRAMPKLNSLLYDARAAGFDLYIASAYRSFEMQNDLKAQYKITYGSGTANSFSADQGYSEHQLGSTVDFTTKKIGGGLAGFDKTPEYQWLLDNAYKYGFILSYPKGNDYYVFEPWHWRFVGVALATRLHEEHENFIDLEQRQIDPYLVTIFN